SSSSATFNDSVTQIRRPRRGSTAEWHDVSARSSEQRVLPLVEVIINGARHGFGNTVYLHKVFHRSPAHGLRRTKMQEQSALARGAHADDLVERAFHHLLLAPGPMRTDGEAMRLVTQPLDEIEHRIAYRQGE